MMFQAKDTTNNRLIFVAVKEITLQNALKDPGVRGLASVDKVTVSSHFGKVLHSLALLTV